MPTTTDRVVLFDADSMQDPYPLFERLRAEAPVHRAVTALGMNVWIVTRYEEARAALSDPRLSKDAETGQALFAKHATDPTARREFADGLMKHMLVADPPNHTRLRKLVGRAFTARRVEALRPRIEQIADELLDGMAAAEQTDLIENFAFQLPITVICELLGVPVEDRSDFRGWSNTLLSNAGGDVIAQSGVAMVQYLNKLIASKRAEPADDMLTALVEASADEDRLSEAELISMIFLLLVAGHETTVNLIGNGVLALLRNPEQLAALRADDSLLPGAIEEFLRYDGPVKMATFRHTAEPVRIGEVDIPADELVLVSLAAADRDGSKFPDPDRFDITRATNGHLAFGHGIHFCVGAPLARMEGEIAIRKLLARYPNLRLAAEVEQLQWRDSTLMRGVTELPVRL